MLTHSKLSIRALSFVIRELENFISENRDIFEGPKITFAQFFVKNQSFCKIRISGSSRTNGNNFPFLFGILLTKSYLCTQNYKYSTKWKIQQRYLLRDKL